PSYMATLDEIHSTRGRARILFDAISNGGLLERGFSDSAAKDALDLCLACKSCKSECPSSVDMAAYRAEYFSHYYASHRRPLAAHFFGRIHEIGRITNRLPLMPQLANLAMRVGGRAAKRLLGIHQSRALPRFAFPSFRAGIWRHQMRSAARFVVNSALGRADWHAPRGPEVLLFPDTFHSFFEPGGLFWATLLLEECGFEVRIPAEDLCCGRPLYDQGMLARAKWRLRRVMNTLGPLVERGVPIVGVEPSCILTFRDELPALFPNDPRAAALAHNSFMLDEFLAREGAQLEFDRLDGRAIVHGHCHQKALAGMDSTANLLARIPGLEVEMLDAGCCGMAGAFGYAREHFEVSQKIAERALLPAIAKAPPDALIVSDGFSCRTQIRQFLPSRQPLPLAGLLHRALRPRAR
ncbi:MAG TPA: heterodisulfide reductase-related iron-sulfur binding cluster, partial [Candidatus Binataceae bacterium]|nr:heterodisulfide reductase-related iron-sulfur binding cluster [Candidatus Binataceae bacterium]